MAGEGEARESATPNLDDLGAAWKVPPSHCLQSRPPQLTAPSGGGKAGVIELSTA